MSLIADAFYLYFLKWLHLPLQTSVRYTPKDGISKAMRLAFKKRRLPVSDILLLLPEIQNSKN